MEYLGQEEKAMVARSKMEALETKAVKLRRELITAIDDANTGKEKAKALANELRVEKQLTLQKDE